MVKMLCRSTTWLLLVVLIVPVQIVGGKTAMAAPSVSQIIDTGQLALNGDGNARGYNDLYQFANPGNTWELVGAWNFNNATHNSKTCSGASNSSGGDGPASNSWGDMKFNALSNYGAGISAVLKTAENITTGVTLSTEITKSGAALDVGKCSDVCSDTEYYACSAATAIRTGRRTTQTIGGVSYIYPDRFFKLGAPAAGTIDAQWSNRFSGLDPAGRYQFQFIYTGIRGLWENITSTASASGASSTTSNESRLDTFTGLSSEINRYRNRITTEVMGADTYTLLRTQKSAQFPLVLNAFAIYRMARTATTASHSSLPIAPTYGNNVTLSTQVTDGATGTVTFKDSALNTLCTTGALANGVASCTWNPTSIGTYSVQAVYAGDNSYKPSTSVSSDIVVGRKPLVITASSPTVGFGDAVPTISPSYATFVNGDAANVITGLTCATAYTTATAVGATPSTSCSGASASNYSISYVAGSVTVVRQTQAALSLASDAFDYGTTLTLTGAGGSGGGDYSYSLSSSGTAGCSRSGAVLSASSTGTCTVSVTRDSSTNYEPKIQLFTIVVNPGDQSLLMIDDVSGAYGSALSLATSGGSGTGAVSYTVTAAGTAGCSLAVNGTDLVATSAGTCTVKATKAASANHKTLSTSDVTVTFAKIAQPNSLSLSDSSVTFGSTLVLSALGGNGGGALSYDVTAPGSAGCSLASATLSVTAGGTCIVTATRATTTNYLERTDSFTMTVSRANQATLSIADVNGAYGDPLILSTTGGSGSGTVSYVVSAGIAGCSLLAGAVTVSSIGTCLVTATKASDNSYNQKSSVLTTLTFVRGAQSSLVLVDDGMLFGATLTLATTGGNGDGSVSYALATGSAGCTVNSGIVSATATGTCSVTVTKAASANYLAKVQTFTITVGVSPQIALAISTTTGVVGTSIALRFTGGSGNGAVTWAITEIGTARCGLIGSTLLAASVGTCEVKVTKAAEDNYLVATTTQSVTITAVPKETKDSGQIVTPTITVAPTTTIATTTTTTTTTIPSAVGTPNAEIAQTGAIPQSTTTTTTTASQSRSTTTTTMVSVQDALMKRVAGVGAGEALIVQGDSSFAATVVRQNNSLVMTAGTFKATIRGIDRDGNVLPLDSHGDIRIPVGGSIAVDMGHYGAGSDVFVWMFSTPRLLKEQHANEQGNIVSRIDTPADLEEGLHRVAFVGKNPAGRDITFMVGVIVAEPSQLSTVSKVLIAIPLTLAVFAGFLLPTTLHRRRRRQRVVVR